MNATAGVARQNGYNMINHVLTSSLDATAKNDLLLSSSGKQSTMREGKAFLVNHPVLKKDFGKALLKLRDAKNYESLGAVELEYQKQIDMICDMKETEITKEKKTLCLYTLQNLIFGLKDHKIEGEKENTYTPKIAQDHYQMLLKGSSEGLDWDKLNSSVYTNEFQDETNPTLANWKFLDARLIRSNMDKINDKTNRFSSSPLNNSHFFEEVQPTPAEQNNLYHDDKGLVRNWNSAEVYNTEDKRIAKCLSKMYASYNKVYNFSDITNQDWDSKEASTKRAVGIQNLWNFVKDSVTTEKNPEVDHSKIDGIVKGLLRLGVEIGHRQQNQNMAQEINQKGEERTI